MGFGGAKTGTVWVLAFGTYMTKIKLIKLN